MRCMIRSFFEYLVNFEQVKDLSDKDSLGVSSRLLNEVIQLSCSMSLFVPIKLKTRARRQGENLNPTGFAVDWRTT